MLDAPGSTDLSKPFTIYSSVNKALMIVVIGAIGFIGMLFFLAAFRNGPNRIGSEEAFLAIGGLGFLYISFHVGKFIFTPRVLIEKNYFLISDFYRKRKLAYDQVSALAEFARMMPIRYNRNNCLRIPVLAIRLRSGKLIQIALPRSQNNKACLDALSNASGLAIESLGVDPSKLNEWRLDG